MGSKDRCPQPVTGNPCINVKPEEKKNTKKQKSDQTLESKQNKKLTQEHRRKKTCQPTS